MEQSGTIIAHTLCTHRQCRVSERGREREGGSKEREILAIATATANSTHS